MKFCLSSSFLLLLVSSNVNNDGHINSAHAFSIQQTTGIKSRSSIKTASALFLSSDGREPDEYDDWYADFDPAIYDSYSSKSSSSSSSSSDHDYSRDPSDDSNIDLKQVNYLIAERLHCRKTGQYQEADSIRDELLEKHGVMIKDRERVWRSGCSRGGSGRNWMRQGGGGGRGGDRFDRGGGRGKRPPRERNFGPNGHDYELAQDAGPNTSRLSDDEIHELIKERMECKMARDFREADAIQEELMSAGVFVHDGMKEWRADGESFAGYGRNQYSPTGGPSIDSLSDEVKQEIQDLVDQRASCKAERLYDNADQIREELRRRFQVTVDDRKKQWTVRTSERERGREFQPFELADFSEKPEDFEEIQQMVQDRDAARADRDFQTADNIRDQLMDRGISINDKLRQWAVGEFPNDEKFKDKHMFTRRGGGSLSAEDEEKITSMLRKRDEHKRNRKFKSADRIRDTLRDEFNIRIDDRNKEWHVVSDEYKMSEDSSPVDSSDKAYIEEQIAKRAEAKLQKDYDTADAIRDTLIAEYNLFIDDRIKEWGVRGYGREEESDDDDGMLEDKDASASADLEESLIPATIEADNSDDRIEEEEEEEEDSMDDSNAVLEELEADLGKLTVPQLKERLREAGLPVSGRKAELIERLTTSS